MFDLFTDRTRRAILYSRDEAEKLANGTIDTEHILLGILREKSGHISTLFETFNVDINTMIQDIKQNCAKTDTFFLKGSMPFSANAKRAMEFALEEARLLGEKFVQPEHILLGLIKEKRGKASQILTKYGFDLYTLREELQRLKVQTNKSKTETPNIDYFCKDLTKLATENKLDPVIERDSEIDRLIEILCRRTKNNAILIGEPGTGKTAIVEGLAIKIANAEVPLSLRNKRIISMEFGTIVAGTKYRGQFEERMQVLLKEVENSGDIIVFIDEIHTMVGAGDSEGGVDAANILKPYLSKGLFQCIGATTIKEYRKYIEKDSALERRFQTILVEPPTPQQTKKILLGLKNRYEQYHKVFITDEIVDKIIHLSERYITDRYQPDKSIDILDEASSHVKLKNEQFPEELKNLKDKLNSLLMKKKLLINAENYVNAERITTEIESLGELYRKRYSAWLNRSKNSYSEITISDINEIVSKISRINISNVTSSDIQKALMLKSKLESEVIGQSEAIEVVAKAIKKGVAGLHDGKKPIANFLFLGPTGVGKTELAKQLALNFFGKEDFLIRVDMSEFMEKHSVSKLLGSPPGYVGYDDGGKLTEMIRRKPYSVVLFDEIEKADPEVLNILLQIMDEGFITDSYGRRCSFKNAIIIMTSNLGTKSFLGRKKLGFNEIENNNIDYETFCQYAHKEIKEFFRPEFLNRIDNIVVFKPLGQDDLMKIIDKYIKEINDLLSKNGKYLNVSENVKKFILSQEYDYSYGARPLRRLISKFIEDPLSELLLDGKFHKRKNISVILKNNSVHFR
ncbi:ATP-dependent Clp protease ATP-binding subunit [Calditerrivibrio sp.]|jgi:ATP-dependent Clp protease ATP-binding subunit ClpC|uniref:ATP-dependent Clp protease ATP-binding subunit n=1 Tax=Calditerrivibrio sp. TaxID=2792612 RepID=UPI003D13422C